MFSECVGMNKEAYLRNLKAQIEKEFGEDGVWFFPRGNDKRAERYFETDLGRRVKGFWGTGEKSSSEDVVMIIAERPSVGRGRIPKEFDKRLAWFYELLEKTELDNSHLTDFIKTRAKVGYDWKRPRRLEFYEKEFDQHLPFLSSEINIVRPTKIIAIGEKTYLWIAICKSFLRLKDIRLVWAPHYANRFKKKEEFEKEFLASIGSSI